MNRVYNFSAGPSMLPVPVLEKAAADTNGKGDVTKVAAALKALTKLDDLSLNVVMATIAVGCALNPDGTGSTALASIYALGAGSVAPFVVTDVHKETANDNPTVTLEGDLAPDVADVTGPAANALNTIKAVIAAAGAGIGIDTSGVTTTAEDIKDTDNNVDVSKVLDEAVTIFAGQGEGDES